MVVANQAIGDAYTIANQCDKALESYQDALKELHLISPHHPYHIQLLLKQSNTLQRKGQLKDAQKVLDEIKNTLGKSRITPPPFSLPLKKLTTPFRMATFHVPILKKRPDT